VGADLVTGAHAPRAALAVLDRGGRTLAALRDARPAIAELLADPIAPLGAAPELDGALAAALARVGDAVPAPARAAGGPPAPALAPGSIVPPARRRVDQAQQSGLAARVANARALHSGPQSSSAPPQPLATLVRLQGEHDDAPLTAFATRVTGGVRAATTPVAVDAGDAAAVRDLLAGSTEATAARRVPRLQEEPAPFESPAPSPAAAEPARPAASAPAPDDLSRPGWVEPSPSPAREHGLAALVRSWNGDASHAAARDGAASSPVAHWSRTEIAAERESPATARAAAADPAASAAQVSQPVVEVLERALVEELRRYGVEVTDE
jgi:hypothetical protein